MQIKVNKFTRGDAQTAMEEWLQNYPTLPTVDRQYAEIRNNIQKINLLVRDEMSDVEESKKYYYLDSHLGLGLYEYLWSIPGFSMRVAANDDFWRFLSLKVVPDVVSQRWGKDNESHFWSRPTRIYLRSIWWYIHLAWQGNKEKTKELIECSHFNTDTILNFEERSGRNGTNIEAYRWILYYYSKVPPETVKKHSRGKNGSDDIFRVVMKLNTVKMTVLDPSLCGGGEKHYAKSLYEETGVNFY